MWNTQTRMRNLNTKQILFTFQLSLSLCIPIFILFERQKAQNFRDGACKNQVKETLRMSKNLRIRMAKEEKSLGLSQRRRSAISKGNHRQWKRSFQVGSNFPRFFVFFFFFIIIIIFFVVIWATGKSTGEDASSHLHRWRNFLFFLIISQHCHQNRRHLHRQHHNHNIIDEVIQVHLTSLTSSASGSPPNFVSPFLVTRIHLQIDYWNKWENNKITLKIKWNRNKGFANRRNNLFFFLCFWTNFTIEWEGRGIIPKVSY